MTPPRQRSDIVGNQACSRGQTKGASIQQHHGAADEAGVGHADHEFADVGLYPVHELADIVCHSATDSLHPERQQVGPNTPEQVAKLHFLVFLLVLHSVISNFF